MIVGDKLICEVFNLDAVVFEFLHLLFIPPTPGYYWQSPYLNFY